MSVIKLGDEQIDTELDTHATWLKGPEEITFPGLSLLLSYLEWACD